jgi:hypothetical protein
VTFSTNQLYPPDNGILLDQWSLHAPPTAQEAEDQRDDSQNKKDMNPCTQCVEADKTNEPQYQQNYGIVQSMAALQVWDIAAF